jgi:glycerol-1-phosphate dehydrogenase [NAD(P)+]
MQLPREVLVGNGTIERISEICQKLGFTKSALIIAGHKTHDIAGKTVKELLEREGVEINTLLVETATVKDVDAVEERISKLRPQVVFGVGGGTKIDVAKCGSAQQEIPFISVPTTASHDGIASPLSSIKGFEKPYSLMSQAPIAIIADTDIIMKSPWRFTVSGCGDILAKCTSVRDWKLAHEVTNEYYGTYAASLASMSSSLVMERAIDIREQTQEGIRTLLEALVSCGVAMSIAGNSRPCSGSEHMFSHALDIVAPKPALHGEQCGVGSVMMAKLHGLDWEDMRSTLRLLGAPTTATELGMSESIVIEALVRAKSIRPERYTILSEVNLTSSTARSLAESCGVI